MAGRSGKRVNYDLAGDLFTKLQQLSLQFHLTKSVGENIRSVTNDSTCVSTLVTGALLPVFWSLTKLLMMVYILWRINAMLTLLLSAVIPCMLLALHRYQG